MMKNQIMTASRVGTRILSARAHKIAFFILGCAFFHRKTICNVFFFFWNIIFFEVTKVKAWRNILFFINILMRNRCSNLTTENTELMITLIHNL